MTHSHYCYTHGFSIPWATRCKGCELDEQQMNNERFPYLCTNCFKPHNFCLCRPIVIGGGYRDSRRPGDRVTISVTGTQNEDLTAYSQIAVGHLDIVSMDRRIKQLEEQTESFEQLIAELMLTVKSLTPNK